MRRRDAAIAVMSSLWLAGCATSALDMAPERPDRPWVPTTTVNGRIVAGAPPAPANADGYVLPANPALASVPPPPAIDAARSYSLPELVDLAETNNPATRIAWNDARRAALAAGIAESTFLPKLTAIAIGGVQRANGSSSGAGMNVGDLSTNGAVSAISLQWLLFDFGERAAIVDALEQGSVISNIAFTFVHQQLIHRVAIAFYDHAAAASRLATASQSLSNAEAIQTAAENRYKHGTGTVMEVAQAREGTAQANLAVVQATGGAEDAYLAVITAMGISPLTKLKIADVSERSLSPANEASVETVISEALARRPDMQSAYAAQQASVAKVRAAQAEFKPKFFLSATATYDSGSLGVTELPAASQQPSTVNITGHHLGGSIFAGVSFPLFDGGTRSAELAQARAEADSADAKMDEVRDDAVREIVAADNTLHTSLAACSASTSLETAAQTSFDAALAAYRKGVGSITDATLAETQLLQARNAATDAYSAALSAAATLALATGELGAAPP